MTASLVRTAAALLLGSTAMLSQAATVTLTGFKYGGNAASVTVNGLSPATRNVSAGAFMGKVSFASGGESGFTSDLTDFVTYCVEIDQTFSFSNTGMQGYSVVAGSSYSLWGSPNARNPVTPGKAAAATTERLGKLLSYVGANSGMVDTAAESTSLQLAIWNVIYDNDSLLGGGSLYSSAAVDYNTYANQLLANSASFANTLDVFVLTKDGSQDFVLARTASPITNDPQQNPVPEPASLALSLLGLAAAGAVSRRRRA